MESINNNQSLFLSEFKELRKELSTMKKRIIQLEESHEKQQERLNILERENYTLKKYTELNTPDDNKAVGSVLKRKRTDEDQDQVHEKKIEESKSTSVSADKKKTKTNNKDNDDEEAGVISRLDNGDSIDSLSDDLLHKIVEFDGNCYSKFGSINKRCKNIYDVREYKLKKQTCVYGYGTVDMMLQHYLQKRREGTLTFPVKNYIAKTLIWYNRLDAVEWIIQLGDNGLLKMLCWSAVRYGRINILIKVFLKLDVTMIDELLYDTILSNVAASNGQLETLKWLRYHGAEWDGSTFAVASREGHDEIVQYLRAEGCPEQDEDTDESPSIGSDNKDGDY